MAQEKEIKKASPKAPLAHGVGRRKNAIARAWLRRGKGDVIVNDKKLNSYFDVKVAQMDAMTPFNLIPAAKRYDVTLNVQGGGVIAQAGAARLAIARALVEIDSSLRSELRKHGLLTVDARVKERKKYGQKAARRKFQFVKR